jgi:hypothetical protein
MGNIINGHYWTPEEQPLGTKRLFPIKRFIHVNDAKDMQDARYEMWDPKRYSRKFRYPAKEPAKDY